jgi:Stage II sporulation protein E (SpoIIE)
VLANPGLHDSQRLLWAGDSLVLFSDGVTEARGGRDRYLYGDARLRSLVVRLDDLTAAAMAEAIQLAAMTFSGGSLSDDAVALVTKIPDGETTGRLQLTYMLVLAEFLPGGEVVSDAVGGGPPMPAVLIWTAMHSHGANRSRLWSAQLTKCRPD